MVLYGNGDNGSGEGEYEEDHRWQGATGPGDRIREGTAEQAERAEAVERRVSRMVVEMIQGVRVAGVDRHEGPVGEAPGTDETMTAAAAAGKVAVATADVTVGRLTRRAGVTRARRIAGRATLRRSRAAPPSMTM